MRGSKYTNYERAITGSPAKRHLNGISLAADDGPTINAGFVAFLRGSGPVLLKKSYIFVTPGSTLGMTQNAFQI